MNDCHDNKVKVCKPVDALQGKALDYFESLHKELCLEIESLCDMFEGQFDRQEPPATMQIAKQTEVYFTDSRRIACSVW